MTLNHFKDFKCSLSQIGSQFPAFPLVADLSLQTAPLAEAGFYDNSRGSCPFTPPIAIRVRQWGTYPCVISLAGKPYLRHRGLCRWRLKCWKFYSPVCFRGQKRNRIIWNKEYLLGTSLLRPQSIWYLIASVRKLFGYSPISFSWPCCGYGWCDGPVTRS